MQTIKSVVVVALLLTVCYGAYKAMNAPDVEMPEDLKTWADQNGKDVLPDFEIPAITSNDTIEVPGGDKPVGERGNPLLPQFPAIDIAQTNITANPGSNALLGNNVGQTIELPKLPAMSSTLPTAPTLNGTSSSNTGSTNSIGQLTSGTVQGFSLQPSISPANSSTADSTGPAIPFNPNSLGSAAGAALPTSPKLSADTSIANELIDAGSGAVDSVPLLESTESLSASSDKLTSAPIPSTLTAEQKPSQPTQPYSAARNEALQIASLGKLREALELLSQYYESPDLGYTEHTDLVDILDALAREVIYSDRHLLASPHIVSAQDTLQSLASQFSVNPEFLAAVNKMGSSQALVPNTQIKVIEGPFHAHVSLSRGELTLFLRKLYAGRFPVSVSQKNRPPHARYEIVDRRQDRTFYGANVRIPAGDPTNPYGGFWLSLGNDYAIHGSPEQVTSDLENVGCISLAPLDASDVYRILGKGCAVEIKP